MRPSVPPNAKPSFWTSDRVAHALRSSAAMNLPRGTTPFARVWTDTRTIEAGDLFVALAGERFDAHDFLPDAVAKGAAGVVVSRLPSSSLGVPVFEVSDTLRALGALGRYRRRAWNQPVVGIVGTNGKTSTKELVRAALGSVFSVHATTGNLNNLVGVPLTLLSIPDDAEVAVIEMGTNQPGEIERLRAVVEPTITVVTSIGEEHLEGLGDVAGVLREEMAAVAGVGVAIVPANQSDVAEAAATARRVVTAGLDAGDVRPASWRILANGCGSVVVGDCTIDVPLRGVHNLRNAMLAIAVASELGVSTSDTARGIATMPVPKMRVNVEQVGQSTLINDAYNSNPGSARAALDLLAHMGVGRQRVAVLATMLELGPSTPQLHDAVAREALASDIELIAAVGEFAAAFERLDPRAARVVRFDDAAAVWPALASRVVPDAVILLKGSRGMRLERLVEPITAWARANTAS